MQEINPDDWAVIPEASDYASDRFGNTVIGTSLAGTRDVVVATLRTSSIQVSLYSSPYAHTYPPLPGEAEQQPTRLPILLRVLLQGGEAGGGRGRNKARRQGART